MILPFLADPGIFTMRQSMFFALLFLSFNLVFTAYLPDYRYSSSGRSSRSLRSMSVDSLSTQSLSSTSSAASAPSFCDLIPAGYLQNVKDSLNDSFDPNNPLHWQLLFFRNKITMMEAFDLLERLLKSYPTTPQATSFFLFSSTPALPAWFKLFFRATLEHYFGNQTNRSKIDIEEVLQYNKCANCISYYRSNKLTL